MILLPIVLPILQLLLVGGPFQLYYFFYIAMVPSQSQTSVAQSLWSQSLSILGFFVTAFSAILGLVELVLAYAADFTMNNGGIDSMLINFSIYWIIAQSL